MTFDEFVASKAPVSDAIWDCIKDDIPGVAREGGHMYANNYLIHEADGLFWVHAWWYAPLSYKTLAEAEVALYPWFQEFE